MKNNKEAILLLRMGLAFSFIYAGVSAFIAPNEWVRFIPEFFPGNFITKAYFLAFFSFFEIALGVWLMTNKKIYYASILSSVVLFLITIVNLSSFNIIFTTFSLFLASLALVFLTKK